MSRLSSGPRWIVLLVTLVALLAVATAPVRAQVPGYDYRPGEVLIKFAPSTSTAEASAILRTLGATRLSSFHQIGASCEHITALSVEQAIARYRGDRRVQYIEPNYVLHALVTPNDPLLPQLWGMNNTGQTGGMPGDDIDALQAWNLSTGSSNVLVAIIDTGMDYNHPDLAANVWTNPGEIPGNGIDDDHNGFIDDVHGWDFANNDNDPIDDNGHGTHTSGTIGAIGNNGMGVAGVNWQVTLMPVKFLDWSGSGSLAAGVSAIEYATQMHVRIMSNSWGGGPFSQAMHDAIEAAGNAGIVFVAAAGNNSSNNDQNPAYPASYDLPNIISVAASDANDNLASFSNFGQTTVDLAAPGVNILSTWPGNNYQSLDGTSMATPHVSGAVALIMARFPAIDGLSARGLLLSHVEPVPALAGYVATGGRLNAYLPLTVADNIVPAPITNLMVTGTGGDRVDLSWTATGDDGSSGTATRYDVRYSTTPITAATFDSATFVLGVPAPLLSGSAEHLRVNGLAFSTPYYLALQAFDELGNSSGVSNIATGTTLGPPVVGFAPPSLSADLLTGAQSIQTLTISNTGVSDLSFDLGVQALVAPPVSPPAVTTLPLGNPRATPLASVAARAGVATTYGFGVAPSRGLIVPSLRAKPARVAAGGLKILLLKFGGDVTEMHDLLAAFPDVAQVDIVDGQAATPALVLLSRYNSVIVASTNVLSDPVGVGNVLADYVDGGGGVVLTLASFAHGFEVRGRLLDGNYMPFDLGFGPAGSSSLGPFDAFHPIMHGVTAVNGDLLAQTTVTAGAQLIASWANGYPFVATKGSHVAAVNIFFGVPGYWNGDVPLLMHNAALWAAGVGQFLTLTPRAGLVPPGGSTDVQVTFDATRLNGGTYDASITVASNDPVTPVALVPTHLHVTGAPDIALSTTSLDYGQVFLGVAKPETVAVTNLGTDLLTISSVNISPADYTVPTAGFSLAPNEHLDLIVTFTPQSAAVIPGTLEIHSNDADEALVTVALHGEGVPAPVVAVSPASLTFALDAGASTTSTLTIANHGGSPLNYVISGAAVTPAAHIGPFAAGAPAASFAARAPAASLAVAPGAKAGRASAIPLTGEPVPGAAAHASLDHSPLALAVKRARVSGGAPVLVISDGGTETDVSSVLTAAGYTVTLGPDDAFWDGTNPSPSGFAAVVLLDGINYGNDMPLAGQNALLSYVTSGGGLIISEWIGFEVESGRYSALHALMPFTRTGGTSGTFQYFVSLDHPVTAGVSPSFLVSSGMSPGIASSGMAVVTLADGSAAVVVGDYGLGHVVEFGMAGNYGGYRPLLVPDMQRLLVNSADWVGGSQWLRTSSRSGTVPAGGSEQVTVTADASALIGGVYERDLLISSNDPVTPVVRVLTRLTVIGIPHIAADQSVLDFGSGFVGIPDTLTLMVRNTGTDVLHVTGMSVGSSDYDLLDGPAFNLAPATHQDMRVRALRSAPGAPVTTLDISSDDPSTPKLTVTLQSVSLMPPVIAVAPESVAVNLLSGQTATRTLTVSNTGLSPLRVTLGTAGRIVATAAAEPSPAFVSLAPAGAAGASREGAGAALESPMTMASAGKTAGAPSSGPTLNTTAPSRGLVALAGDYSGARLHFGLSDYGEIMPFAYPLGNEHLQWGAYISGYTVAYTYGSTDYVWYAAFDSRYGILPVSYRELTNTALMLVVEVVTQTADARLQITRTFTFQKSDKGVRVETVLHDLTGGGLQHLIYKEFADWDVDSAFGDTWDYDRTRNMAYASYYHFAAIAGQETPALMDINGWNDYSVGPTTVDIPVGPVSNLDGLEILHYELGALAPSGSRSVVTAYCAGDNLADLQSVVDQTVVGSKWLSVSPSALVIAAGGSKNVTLSFDASGLIGGNYDAFVVLDSNDPFRPEVRTPAHLHVTGVPHLAASPLVLDFGSLFIGAARAETVYVANTGTDLLTISGVTASPADYTAPSTGFSLEPGQSLAVLVTFSPLSAAMIPGTLKFDSNDPAMPVVTVTLNGQGLLAPVASVSPASLSADLLTGAVSEQTLTLRNLGGSDLTYHISSTLLPPTPRVGGGTRSSPAAWNRRAAAARPGAAEARSERPPSGTRPLPAQVSITNAAKVLLIEDTPPWFTNANEQVLAANGIAFDLIGTSLLDSVPLGHYSLVIVPSDQPSATYATLAAHAAQFDTYVMAGGVLEFHAAGWGFSGGDASIVTLPGGMQISQYYSYTNHVLDPAHPIMSGVPEPFTGTSASHAYFTSIPAGAHAIAADDMGRANLVIYRHGNGQVIAGCQTFEFGYNNGQDAGTILRNMIPFAANLGSAWLSTIPSSGSVPPGSSVDVTAKLDATGMFGGDYVSYLEIDTNDPVHAILSVPAHLHVTGAPDIALSTTAIDFGQIFAGATSSEALLISNRGTDVLTVTSIDISPAVFHAPMTGFTVAVGHTASLPVTYAPMTVGISDGSLTIHSDDPDQGSVSVTLHGEALDPPRVAVIPLLFQELIPPEGAATEILTILNSGGNPLTWNASVGFASTGTVLEHQTIFASVDTFLARSAASPAHAPTPSLIASAPGVAAPAAQPARAAPGRLAGRGALTPAAAAPAERPATPLQANSRILDLPALTDVLSQLNARYSLVTGLIPHRFDFLEGEFGDSIIDGGQNMYDGGNHLQTDVLTRIPYSNNAISFGPGFGGPYFTRKYPGLFVLAADLATVQTFNTFGDLGADGAGHADGAILSVDFLGTSYVGYVKRVYGAGTASVNHLIILPDSGATGHGFTGNTNNDFDKVTGLDGERRLYYLLFAGDAGAYIDDAAMLDIMQAFLVAAAPTPTWVYVAPSSGQVAAHGSSGVDVRFSAHGLAPGSFDAQIVLNSNDPSDPHITIPVNLVVSGPTGTDVALVSSSAEPGVARLTWYATQAGGMSAAIQRRTLTSAWTDLGSILPDGQGFLKFEDRSVAAGERYGYRLGISEAGAVRYVGETWVDVPEGASFALRGLRPNPALSDLLVEFTLPDGAPATLELLDLAGRRLMSQEVGVHGAGRHVLSLGPVGTLRSGVYLVRLQRGDRKLVTKGIILQ